MAIFKKPKWIRPELDEPIYYVHIAIILAVVYLLMQWNTPGDNILLYGVYLIIADGISHTVLRLD